VLKLLDDVVGTTTRPQTAIIFDWENRWALENAIGLGENVKYVETCLAQYRPLWERGVPVDVIDETVELDRYQLVIAPMLYLLRAGIAERIERFVAGGGTLVATYWSGIVDENDLCYLGGFPGGGLRPILGIWDEELDVLQSFDENTVVLRPDNALGLEGEYRARELCTLIHSEGAQVLGTYGGDFYAGRPALTVNLHGRGQAFYMASRNEDAFLDAFYGRLVSQLNLKRALHADLPAGMTAQLRTDGEREFVFLMNFNPSSDVLDLGSESYVDRLTGNGVTGKINVPGYGCLVLERS
jgi:beta-galactosidase